jgi:hypothetical protein
VSAQVRSVPSEPPTPVVTPSSPIEAPPVTSQAPAPE